MDAQQAAGEKEHNAGEGQALNGEVGSLEADVQEALELEDTAESELDNLKNQLAAARADLYNYRQRVERERAKTRRLIAEEKAAEFLPVLDNLDRALLVPEGAAAKDVLAGVRMVQKQFLTVLENSGVTVIPTVGCAFDPLQHEAIETEFVEDAGQDGRVLNELLRGYQTPERVLRVAQVRVGRLKKKNGLEVLEEELRRLRARGTP